MQVEGRAFNSDHVTADPQSSSTRGFVVDDANNSVNSYKK